MKVQENDVKSNPATVNNDDDDEEEKMSAEE